MEDEVGAMFALMSLLLVGCLLIPNMLVVVFLSLVALSVFNALSYYFIHDKTQEKDMRELARWAFIISACAVLVIVPIMSIVQIVWMIKFY
jgi:flagellar biosynthesis protein FlhB